MNILFLIRSLEVGGAERQMVALANGMAQQGHNVGVAVYYGGGYLERTLQNVTLINLHKKGRWNTFSFLKRLIKEVRDFQPSVVNSFMPEANIVSALFKLYMHCPIIWSIRASNMNAGDYGVISRAVLQIQAFLSRFVDHIVVNSFAGYRVCLKQGFPEKKMTVIHNGIDTTVYYPFGEKQSCIARSELGLLKTEKIVGLVARLDPMKDHINFFQAARIVLSRCDNISFICVGSGTPNYTKFLLDKIEEYNLCNHIVMLGEKDDMNTLYNSIDILCSTSKYGEGFSNVIGEAMACGVPCVVTEVGDSEKIVGSTGKVVPPGKPDALAKAIVETVQLLGSQAIDHLSIRKRIETEFSKDALIEKNTLLFNSFQ